MLGTLSTSILNLTNDCSRNSFLDSTIPLHTHGDERENLWLKDWNRLGDITNKWMERGIMPNEKMVTGCQLPWVKWKTVNRLRVGHGCYLTSKKMGVCYQWHLQVWGPSSDGPLTSLSKQHNTLYPWPAGGTFREVWEILQQPPNIVNTMRHNKEGLRHYQLSLRQPCTGFAASLEVGSLYPKMNENSHPICARIHY